MDACGGSSGASTGGASAGAAVSWIGRAIKRVLKRLLTPWLDMRGPVYSDESRAIAGSRDAELAETTDSSQRHS